MKSKFIHLSLIFFSVVLFSACTKQDYYSGPTQEERWMQTHEKAVVAFVDNYSGNYIAETYQGYSVIAVLGGIVPRQYDNEYAWFSSTGAQSVYNYEGNYFTTEEVVASRLNWSDALYVLDQLNHGQY